MKNVDDSTPTQLDLLVLSPAIKRRWLGKRGSVGDAFSFVAGAKIRPLLVLRKIYVYLQKSAYFGDSGPMFAAIQDSQHIITGPKYVVHSPRDNAVWVMSRQVLMDV